MRTHTHTQLAADLPCAATEKFKIKNSMDSHMDREKWRTISGLSFIDMWFSAFYEGGH